MDALWTCRPLRIISDQDLATKSLNTSESHQCLRMSRLEISLAKLSSKASWRGDFIVYAHWPICVASFNRLTITLQQGELTFSGQLQLTCIDGGVVSTLHCDTQRSSTFFFLSTVYVLWRITILTKCTWLICGDVWRCRVFRCHDFAWIWWKTNNDSQDTQSRNSGFMRIEVISPVNSLILRIPGHLIKQIIRISLFHFKQHSHNPVQNMFVFFLWHGPAKDLTKDSWIYETIIMNLESSLFQAMVKPVDDQIESNPLQFWNSATSKKPWLDDSRYWSVLPWLFQRFVSFWRG